MSSDKKQIIAKIARDIESYAGYLKENGVTEVAASRQERGDASGVFSLKVGPDCQSGRPNSKDKRNPSDDGLSRPATESSFPGVEMELKKVAAAVAACKKCVLHEKRNRTVPGQGKPAPDILFIGEGPGEDEDRQGLAFVGRAGQLLTRLIKRMGYSREEVFIANIVKCRPPGNRKPLPEEMSACLPYLEEQIGLLQPKVIVILGATSLEALISPDIRISRARGKWMEYRGIPVMPTFHPSYLLRNQSAMWDVWADMQQVLERLGRPVPAKP